jgi:general secretion pathway protein K
VTAGDERGVALIIVLWGVTLLSLLAVSLAQGSGLAARRALHTVEAAQARARLDEAVAASVLALARTERPWRADGAPHMLTLPGATAEVSPFAEAGRIDLNAAPPALLQSLFRRAAGADAGDRLAAALAARVAARPLLAVAELGGLPGMSAPLYHRLAGAATVRNPSGKIAWRLADKSVLAALPGIDEAQAATLVAMRGQSQYAPEPALAELLTRAGAVADPDPASSGGTMMVSLRISLTLAGGGRASADALLQLLPSGPAAYRILEWRSPADEAQ